MGDGVFMRDEDGQGEEVLARRLAEVFDCEVRRFPVFAAVDAYAVRDGRVAAVLEFKRRTELVDPVWVSKRKVEALLLLSAGFSVHLRPCVGLFVVQCGDRVGYVQAEEARGYRWEWVGRTEKREGAVHDMEECHLVPVGAFHWLNGGPPGAGGE